MLILDFKQFWKKFFLSPRKVISIKKQNTGIGQQNAGLTLNFERPKLISMLRYKPGLKDEILGIQGIL